MAGVSKEISQTFQHASTLKQTELDQQIEILKEPLDDFRLMIEAALDACYRRRKIVFAFYEAKEQLRVDSIGSDTFDQYRRE